MIIGRRAGKKIVLETKMKKLLLKAKLENFYNLVWKMLDYNAPNEMLVIAKKVERSLIAQERGRLISAIMN